MSERIVRSVEIVNKRGLHARASSKFAMLAQQFEDARVRVAREDQEVDGDSIMDLLMLAAGMGSTVDISAEGPRAEEAVTSLAALVADRFGEGE